MSFNEDQTAYDGFACHCSPAAKKEMAALHRWVRKTYGWKARDKYMPRVYVTRMLYELAGSYHAWIEGVPLDPGGWGAITVESGESKDYEGTKLRTDIQFDQFEDGLALTLKTFHEKYGESRKYIENDDE